MRDIAKEFGLNYLIDRRQPQPSSPSYTLADLQALFDQWCNEQDGDREMLRWTLSILLEWLARKEREANAP